MILNEFKSIIIKENIYLWKIRRFNGLYRNLETIIILEKKKFTEIKKTQNDFKGKKDALILFRFTIFLKYQMIYKS